MGRPGNCGLPAEVVKSSSVGRESQKDSHDENVPGQNTDAKAYQALLTLSRIACPHHKTIKISAIPTIKTTIIARVIRERNPRYLLEAGVGFGKKLFFTLATIT